LFGRHSNVILETCWLLLHQ